MFAKSMRNRYDLIYFWSRRSDHEEIAEARAEAERKGFEAELKRLRTISEAEELRFVLSFNALLRDSQGVYNVLRCCWLFRLKTQLKKVEAEVNRLRRII